jgi:hypothetical protein
MISLYESILGSTKSGKDKILRDKIQAWIDTITSEKITSSFGHNHKNKFVINNDLSVSYSGDLYLDMFFNKDGNLQELIEIPEYIIFNTIEGNFHIKMYTINKMQKNQFPKIIIGNCSIKSNNTTLKDVHICAKSIIIVNNSLLSKIDNVEFELAPDGYFDFSNSDLTLEEFKKIKFVNGNLESIECSNTPMGDTLLKTRNKFFKKEDMEGFREYMKEIVPKTKFPHLLKIVIKPKRKLLDTALKDWWILTDQYGKWITK